MPKEFRGAPAKFRADVPDIFVDEVTGFDIINGTLRFDLATLVRADPIAPSSPVVAVIGRAIIPLESAKRLALGLYSFLEGAGHDPKELVAATDEKAN